MSTDPRTTSRQSGGHAREARTRRVIRATVGWLSVLVAMAGPSVASAAARSEPATDPPPASAPVRRIAVTPFGVAEGVPAVLGAVVADMLVSSIDALDVELVERQRIGRVLDEQAFAASGLTQPGEAVRLGRIADVRWILIGDLYRVDGVYVASGRLVDAETGSIHERARGAVQFRAVDDMPARLAELAEMLGLRRDRSRRWPAPEDEVSAVTLDSLVEVVSPDNPHGVSLSIAPGTAVVRSGTVLDAALHVDQPGFLSLLAIDAAGRISRLVPNERVPEFVVRPGETVRLPADLGFRLVVRPPLGPTRLKAVVTDRPLDIEDVGITSGRLAAKLADMRWSSTELEFVVVSAEGTLPEPDLQTDATPGAGAGSGDASGASESVVPGTDDGTSIRDAFDRWLIGDPDETVPRSLSWWRDDSEAGVHWRPSDAVTPIIAVIDADFDPDDDCLRTSLVWLDEAAREMLRQDIRRHGEVPLRHGNRVAALIAADSTGMSSAVPGARLLPIPVTSTARGSGSRVRTGGADEVIRALRTALAAGARVINLSLSLRLDGDEREAFMADPVWDRLEAEEVVVVCAAGNDGGDRDLDPLLPAAVDRPNIVVVTAHGPEGHLLPTAAHGARAVDLSAPGGPLFTSDGGGIPVLASGSSYAAALVSGAAAVIIAEDPPVTAANVVKRLREAARVTPETTGRVSAGRFRWPR